jgi:hypothetical protein
MTRKFNLWPDVVIRKTKAKVDQATGEVRDDNDIPY